MMCNKEIECFECQGEGYNKMIFFASRYSNQKIFTINDPIFTCQRCNGTGKISSESEKWVVKGRELKEYRISFRKTLREACKFLKMDVSKLSYMERGIIEPDMSINYNKIKLIKK